jgi:hypothetical protein
MPSPNVQDWLILGNQGISTITFDDVLRVAFIDPTARRIHDPGYRTNFNPLPRDVSKTGIIFLRPSSINKLERRTIKACREHPTSGERFWMVPMNHRSHRN